MDASGNVSITSPTSHTYTVTDGPITIQAPSGLITVSGKDIVVHASHSYSEDVYGYGSRITYEGGSNYQQDTYTTGATVTSTEHGWSPPEIPLP
jgi:hypothetical protein